MTAEEFILIPKQLQVLEEKSLLEQKPFLKS